MRRRHVRLTGFTLATVLTLTGCGLGPSLFGEEVDTVGEVTFDQELVVPPLADSHLDGDGRRVFDLGAAPGTSEFRPGQQTATWGFNGDYLGPTLRARRGEDVVVNVHNGLDETTTVHWHGMHLPPEADGGPHQAVEPGDSWSPTWQIDQPATTLWYHPHPHGATEKHVHRGLAGMFIIDDPDSPVADDLPHDYGVDDIPVIVQDRRFDDDGQFVEGEHEEVGMLGDTLLVNGTLGPFHDVTTERARLRLLNGSTARTYDFGFADDRRFALVGTDGGLLEGPHDTDRIRLSPGERAEIVVTVQPGERAVLRSYPPDLGMDGSNLTRSGGNDQFDVLELRAASDLEPSPAVPDQLAEIERYDPADAEVTRQFELRSRKINGEQMDMNRIDEVVEVDTTEIWEVENGHGEIHSFHVHDVQFQVLDVDGEAPPPELAGWKDTILLPPRTPIRLIMRFTDYTDPGVPYMYHCHLLLHEDEGMMGQFVVVEPGQDAADSVGGHHEH